ncbi:MAG: PSD1 and planctomycete cytochrome C domain-containing protein, partial [Pirellula sp.]
MPRAIWILTIHCIFSSRLISGEIDFVRDIRPIFVEHCYECHSSAKQESGFRLDLRGSAFRGGDNRGPDIVPGKSAQSPLMELIRSPNADLRMPPDKPLPVDKIERLKDWIDQGAVWPAGVDSVSNEDRTNHWSFKPLKSSSTAPSIDSFIDASLRAKGLVRSTKADPIQWLRRVTHDLTGLPPTLDEATMFRQRLSHVASIDLAYEEVVDRLLASPRYGERWAQHWLDVVRYADTHGFEVNTERPNAWPYRDYIIRALNEDTSYDQLIREQIAGDAYGKDAATGFLVTASVLLPGQIGKDAPSIRLARQDALDEIVNNLGQTFLGLSIGCARCHDHKFDPISSIDYYSMQAIVSGVEYDDREIQSEEAAERKQRASHWYDKIATLEQKLDQFAPLASPSSPPRSVRSDENSHKIPSVPARFVRFEILDANLHSSLGLIEPCIDEFEIFADNDTSKNLAIASQGTLVTSSGSKESDKHQLRFVNDGVFGNGSSWMSNAKGYGWLLFELPQQVNIKRIAWSRDRTGGFQDRTPIAYRLQVGADEDSLTTVVEVPPQRPAINRLRTLDRISPIKAKRMRFSIAATNSLEPCIDEIEVFNTQGKNVALASVGTTLKTSGNTLVPERHDPSYIHDGKYGDDSSWLGDEDGRGWIEFEFASEEELQSVVWSRDRKGDLVDRLPIEYKIEIASSTGWKCVADSSDRRTWRAGMDLGPSIVTANLKPDEARVANELIQQRNKLESQARAIEKGNMVFAGKFRAPDTIHWLNRGDPEQPREPVVPSVPKSLGSLGLASSCSDLERRLGLADWIASESNPLTARVMVNRVWQGHFGTGLVDTPSDFGWSGSKPTHPELLDWLSQEFMKSAWSLKRLHRSIVLSETYGQSSDFQANTPPLQMDIDNRLLWRFPGRRLDAEEIRDTMLAISGELRLEMYGRGFNVFDQRGGLSGFKPVESFPPEGLKRAIYGHRVRRERDAVFGAYDCPDAGQSTAKRRESTTPIQALNLLNSTFTLERAKAFAMRIRSESRGTDGHIASTQRQVVLAYNLA